MMLLCLDFISAATPREQSVLISIVCLRNVKYTTYLPNNISITFINPTNASTEWRVYFFSTECLRDHPSFTFSHYFSVIFSSLPIIVFHHKKQPRCVTCSVHRRVMQILCTTLSRSRSLSTATALHSELLKTTCCEYVDRLITLVF